MTVIVTEVQWLREWWGRMHRTHRRFGARHAHPPLVAAPSCREQAPPSAGVGRAAPLPLLLRRQRVLHRATAPRRAVLARDGGHSACGSGGHRYPLPSACRRPACLHVSLLRTHHTTSFLWCTHVSWLSTACRRRRRQWCRLCSAVIAHKGGSVCVCVCVRVGVHIFCQDVSAGDVRTERPRRSSSRIRSRSRSRRRSSRHRLRRPDGLDTSHSAVGASPRGRRAGPARAGVPQQPGPRVQRTGRRRLAHIQTPRQLPRAVDAARGEATRRGGVRVCDLVCGLWFVVCGVCVCGCVCVGV